MEDNALKRFIDTQTKIQKKPLISICVSVYNLENYIEQCLMSILNQGFDDFELIVVDNGSVDKSVEICERIQSAYSSKMIFIKCPLPTVLGRAIHTAIENVSGEYFQIVDGDDYLADGYLSEIATIIHDKQPNLIFGSFECVVEDGAIAINDAIIDGSKINDVSTEEAVEYLLRLPNFHKTQWRFIKQTDFAKISSLDNVEAKDIELIGMYGDMIGVIVWLLSAESMVYYEGPFYYYRCRNQGNMSTAMHSKTTGDFLKTLLLFQKWKNTKYVKTSNPLNKSILKYFVELVFKLFTAGVDLISNEECEHLGMVLMHHKKLLRSLSEYEVDTIDDLISNINTLGEVNGLKKYIVSFEADHFNRLLPDKEKKIYIFPAGIFSVGNSRKLIRHGYDVKGFFDNDVTKQGKYFNGIVCLDQNEIMEAAKDEHSVILLSTIYDELIPTLVNQAKSIGFKDIRVL